MINIKSENLKRYSKEFHWVSNDQVERVKDYLEKHPFTKAQAKRFHKCLEKISKTKWNTLKCVLYIIPEATPRPRLGMRGKFYVKNARSNNEFVELLVKKEKDLYHLVDSPCRFFVDSYFPIPKAFSQVDTLLAELGLIQMETKPDWDNIGKTYSDMIQKWILTDDSLIFDGRSQKHYSLKPRVEITIEYMENSTAYC